MSVTFKVTTERAEPQPGDRFSQDLDAPTQNAYMVGTLSADLEPDYLPGPVSLDAMLAHTAPGDRPVWEWFGRHGWAFQIAPSGSELNLTSAAELMHALGLSPEPCGSIRARELRTACDRLLSGNALARDDQAGQFGEASTGNGARWIRFARRAGYLREKTTELRALADRAGDLGVINWA